MSTSSAPIRPRGLRAGRVVLIGVAGLLTVLVAIVWILPGMLDWNRYRGSIASLVAAGIGRPVRIDGNITLHLLPQPVLTATDLKVDDAGDGVVMQVRAVRLGVALEPLIAGRVDARELTMQGADLRLPWPPPAGALSRRPPAWITGLQARVEDSRLQIGELVLGKVDAALGADPETGTLSAAGSATLFDRPTRFTIRLGRPGRDGAAPLDISLDGQDTLRNTGGTVSGTIEADGSLNGRVVARGPDLSQLLPAPATPWRADGRISAAGGVLVADELALEIGGSPARGAVALRIQPDVRLDLALAAGRLDLDAWTPALLRATQPGRPLGANLAIPTGIDLSADSASLAGGLLRDVRTALDIDAEGVSVREATALLPGDAKASLHGRFPQRGRTFDGVGTLIAPDLRTTLRWLEPVVPALVRALPPGAFRTANLTAKLAVDPAQISFTDLKGTLDAGAVQGGMAIRPGPRPAVSFGLTMDRLLLDPFLPAPSILQDPARAYAGAVKTLAAAGFDSDMKLQVREADWRGARFGPLAIDVQSEAGHLTLRRLEATLAGVHAAISGALGDAGRISEGRLELTAQEVAPLQPFLPPEATGLAALMQGPANLLIMAAGPPEALAARATLELGDLRAEGQPVLNVPAHRWAGPLTLQHPSAARLLAQLGFAGTGRWLGDGSFSFIAQAAKVPGRLELGNVELVAGELRVGGQLTHAGHALKGRIRAETLTLPSIDPRSPDPLPFADLVKLDATLHVDADHVLIGLVPAVTALSADVAVHDGALALDEVVAKRDGAAVSGTVRIEPGALPHVSLQGRLEGLAVNAPLLSGPLDITAGTLGGRVSVTGEGFSPAALTATLAGSGTVAVQDAAVAGFDLPAAAATLTHPDAATLAATLRPTMLIGKTSFSKLEIPFDLHGGVATLRATGLAAGDGAQGSATLGATIDLLSRTIEGRLILSPGKDLPELPVRLTGPLANPVRTPELAPAARWLAERP